MEVPGFPTGGFSDLGIFNNDIMPEAISKITIIIVN